MGRWISNLKRGWKFFKFGFTSYPWDYSYFLEGTELQLDLMRQYVEEHGHLACSDQQAKELKIAVELCNRLRNKDYGEFWYKKIDHIYGDLKMIDLGQKGSFTRSMLMREFETKENQHKIRKMTKRAMKKENSLRKQDLEMLTNLIKRKLVTWWD